MTKIINSPKNIKLSVIEKLLGVGYQSDIDDSSFNLNYNIKRNLLSSDLNKMSIKTCHRLDRSSTQSSVIIYNEKI